MARDDTYMLIVKKDAEYQTLQQFVDYCKAHPGEVKYSITFNGATHAVATLMEQTMDIKLSSIDVGSSTADRLTAFMAGQCDCLVINYADVSASTPATKVAIWEKIKDTGVLFADAAMLGSLPQDKHRVPITASGNGAKTFKETMEPLGMRITLAGDKAGAASAIKLVRSIFMKGIASLMIETMQAADAYDVTEEIVASIGKSMDGIPFTQHLNRLVNGSALHCKRRAAELKGSIAMLEEEGIMSEMTVATKHRLEALEPYNFAEKYVGSKPKDFTEIIEAIRVKK